jgi:hypothetical protein
VDHGRDNEKRGATPKRMTPEPPAVYLIKNSYLPLRNVIMTPELTAHRPWKNGYMAPTVSVFAPYLIYGRHAILPDKMLALGLTLLCPVK